jgi:hypothetical protein
MSTHVLTPHLEHGSVPGSIRQVTSERIDAVMASLPAPEELTSAERREIIARYTAVLEGNFIYWMTAALLAVRSDEAKPILLDNLYEEIRDSHPVMLRKFAIAAHAFPTDADALAVNDDLTRVRLFLGRMSSVQTLLTMAFFEGFIQRFMAYLSELATAQGSAEQEYTDVLGVCDVAHSEGLFQAFAVEKANYPFDPGVDVFEGVNLLTTLIHCIVFGPTDAAFARA